MEHSAMQQFTFGIPKIGVRPVSRRVRIAFNGVVLADSSEALLLEKKGHKPELYVPKGHVMEGALVPAEGPDEARDFYDLEAQGKIAPRAAWSLKTPADETAELEGHVAFDPAQVEITVDEEGATAEAHDSELRLGGDAKAALFTGASRG
jgi:uncharacterized protein (DUF427 family)